MEWDRSSYLPDKLANFPIKSGAHNALHNKHMASLAIPGHNLSFLYQQHTMGLGKSSWLTRPILTYQTTIPPDHSWCSGPLRGKWWPQKVELNIAVRHIRVLGDQWQRLTADNGENNFAYPGKSLSRLILFLLFYSIHVNRDTEERLQVVIRWRLLKGQYYYYYTYLSHWNLQNSWGTINSPCVWLNTKNYF